MHLRILFTRKVWKLRVCGDQILVISFDGVPETSPARRYEEDWIRREGIRKINTCEK